MALAFNDSAGGAKKNKLEYIKFVEGENRMRMIGAIIPRYVYWKQLGTNNIPVECLGFDREEERFTNIEKDWFNHYFPKDEAGKDINCVWSYVAIVIDLKDGNLKLCGLKKKLFEQILAHATKHKGDPTDAVKGWDIVFEKVKTGPHAFNIEYRLDQVASTTRALNKEELETIEDLPNIDDLVPRLTSDKQKQFIENAWFSTEEENADDDAAAAALDTSKVKTEEGFDDDIPF